MSELPKCPTWLAGAHGPCGSCEVCTASAGVHPAIEEAARLREDRDRLLSTLKAAFAMARKYGLDNFTLPGNDATVSLAETMEHAGNEVTKWRERHLKEFKNVTKLAEIIAKNAASIERVMAERDRLRAALHLIAACRSVSGSAQGAFRSNLRVADAALAGADLRDLETVEAVALGTWRPKPC